MTNNPFEANNKQSNNNIGSNNKLNSNLANTNYQGNTMQEPRKSNKGIAIIAAAIFPGIVFFIIFVVMIIINMPQSPNEEIIQQDITNFGVGELEIGESIILSNEDLGECRESDIYEDNPCAAFNSNEHFKPGLYTLVYKPVTYVPEGYYSIFELNLNFRDYLELERPDDGIDYFYSFPDLENSFTIENVPMQEDAYIVFDSLAEGMEFTVELIPQSEYKIFVNNSGVTGFYPVGLTVSPGKYELDTKYSFYPLGEIVPVSYDGLTSEEQAGMLKYDDDEIVLEENQIFVSYSPNNSLV